jgi:2-oxoisovalerate dehydrogenase E1 component
MFALAGKIQLHCFAHPDAPVSLLGAASLPAIPLNSILEAEMLPNADKVAKKIEEVLGY